MGYNYSKWFLAQHKESVENLIQAAKSGQLIEMEFDEPEDLTRRQFLVNNLLASLELNFPEQHGKIRKHLRTWTEFKGEKWRLYVGTPRTKIGGRAPRSIVPGPQMGAEARAAQHLAPMTRPGPAGIIRKPIETFGELIDDRESWERFITWTAQFGDEVRQINAEFGATPNRPEVVNIFRAAGWIPSLDGTALTLKRKADVNNQG